MAITDELRGFMDGADGYELWCPRHKVELEDIADHIDAAHRAALEKLAAQVDETSGMREFCERLDQAATSREDVQLWGVDYTPLPLDADGVPIHIGDRVENNERVERIVLTDGSWEPSVYVEKLPNVLHEYFCNEISHYHAPTVEDVLREFAREIDADAYGITDAKVAEFAAKLRLAGEGE